MAAFIDLRGKRFGRLVVEGRSSTNTKMGKPRWDCLCDCGGKATSPGNSLRSLKTASCGCLQRERTSAAARISSRKHGLTGSPEYRSWGAMLTRCNNPNATGYNRYGGAGVRVCERWLKFENFLADMGERPSLDYSLDRYPDKFGDYEPSNCRWATAKEQQANRRDTVNGRRVNVDYARASL